MQLSFERRVRSTSGLVVALVAFVGLVIAGRTFLPTMAVEQQPTDRRKIFNRRLTHHLQALNGKGKQIQQARDAEMVLIGNSRLMWVFTDDNTAEFEQRHQIDCVRIGTGNVIFQQELIRRNDLRPNYVVVHCEVFFTPQTPKWAKAALEISRVDAQKKAFESAARDVGRGLLCQWFPRIPAMIKKNPNSPKHTPKPRKTSKSAPKRRVPHRHSNQPPRPFQFRSDDMIPISREEQRLARAFRDFLTARGSQLVLTYVVSPINREERAREFARLLNVPFVLPPIDKTAMQTLDGSHLDPESAAQFCAAFFEEFERVIPNPFNRYLDRTSNLQRIKRQNR